MSKENLDQFCILVLGDLNLQNQLKILTDRNDFIARVIELGADNGFEISREDIENQMGENRRLWNERWV